MINSVSEAPHLEPSTEVYRFLAEGMPDIAIISLDPSGKITTWNVGANQLTGHTFQEVVGKHFSELYTNDNGNAGSLNRELERASTGRYESSGWMNRKDGTRVWVEVTIAAIKEDDGSLQGYVEIVRDATDKLENEARRERQNRDLVEVSTPVITLWDGIIALPIVGTLDSARSQVMMEKLLTELARTGCSVAILDITGVPAIDTLVAQHLMKTIQAARIMGAQCIISGIRPEIAQTIVHLGIDLSSVKTRATMARAFEEALGQLGITVCKKVDAI